VADMLTMCIGVKAVARVAHVHVGESLDN